MELLLNEISQENDEFRTRLGLEERRPIDLTFQKVRKVQKESERALNVILQKEVIPSHIYMTP